jgi:hypothetical protein
MGRKSKLKHARKEKRQRSLDEAWDFFTSRKFLWQVRKMILDSGAKISSCICCTKVYSELAATVGLEVRPLTVEASVFNPVFAAHIEKSGLDPTDAEMKTLGEAGGRFVVLGARDDDVAEPGMWPGHLVAVLRARGKPTTIVDLSIDQASRPAKDIVVTDPLVFGVPDDFVLGKSVATGFVGTKAGKICLVYRAFPEDMSFEASPDWRRDYGAKTHDKIEVIPPETTEKPGG